MILAGRAPFPFATLLAPFKPEAWRAAEAFERALFATQQVGYHTRRDWALSFHSFQPTEFSAPTRRLTEHADQDRLHFAGT